MKAAEIPVHAVHKQHLAQFQSQLHPPAFLLHMFMSATCFQVLAMGSNTSTLFLTKGPSWPPTAYNKLFNTPTPANIWKYAELTRELLERYEGETTSTSANINPSSSQCWKVFQKTFGSGCIKAERQELQQDTDKMPCVPIYHIAAYKDQSCSATEDLENFGRKMTCRKMRLVEI